jgi:uncharacterized protein YgbK (DUF1537 family)
MLLGCIADDFTGATDLANTLTRRGMRTLQTIGIPRGRLPAANAVVIALKSRTIDAAEAVEQSLAACRWLRQHGSQQIYFKYCSTFDSTDRGNIGPVAEALLRELGDGLAVACPAYPENGRTVYLGHLFVGSELLSQSSMRDHPLTPMRDANLVRVLARQTKLKVGLVPYATVKKGTPAIVSALAKLRRNGFGFAIVDAIEDADLEKLGEACAGMALVTGGSGAAVGLPGNFRRQGVLADRAPVVELPEVGGPLAVLSGSCSQTTLAQTAELARTCPALKLDPGRLANNAEAAIAEVVDWALERTGKGPVLIHAGAAADEVAAVQAQFGRERAGVMIEGAMASIAKALVAAGVHRLVVAGGETSGAVVKALGIEALEIGPQIEPGVPATISTGTPRLALVLKSGNFGGPGFFHKAVAALR